MRILEVIHDYLPLHAAGSEIYCSHLCRALKDAGHETILGALQEEDVAAKVRRWKRDVLAYS